MSEFTATDLAAVADVRALVTALLARDWPGFSSVHESYEPTVHAFLNASIGLLGAAMEIIGTLTDKDPCDIWARFCQEWAVEYQ